MMVLLATHCANKIDGEPPETDNFLETFDVIMTESAEELHAKVSTTAFNDHAGVATDTV